MLVKTQVPDFSRDETTGALVNTNANAYRLYKQQRQNQQTVESLNGELTSVKSELNELKALIKTLLEEKNG
jgi:hypothetical protein